MTIFSANAVSPSCGNGIEKREFAFEKPVIVDKVVIFREIKQPMATYDKPREIRVNTATGTITIK
jgi:hypothetical protein